ncbi:MAG: response regulator [Bacteroidia bacterium]|nr:response regulator [Bacteroidia bacterium]
MGSVPKILVVDDDPDLEMLIRQRFRSQIRESKMLFDFAQNGKIALEKIGDDDQFALVLTDINMPVMDGLTLLARLKEKNQLSRTVVISAYGDMNNIRSAMNKGAFDFITKPIDFNDLEVTIDKAIDEGRLIREGTAAKQMLEEAKLETEIAIIERRKAEEAKRKEEQFLANMSHEIRTPMNAVIGMSNLLLRTEVSEQQLKYLKAIKTSSENLLKILNDILDLAKIESGKIELETIPFHPVEVLDTVYQTLRFKADEKGIDFSIAVKDNIPSSLLGDPLRLCQVLINIAGNAVKFTDKGSVKINCRCISQDEREALLEFTIVDTGIGIPEDKIEKIFESFMQASSDHSRKYGGTGLGLTITRQLIELQNGTVVVSSQFGESTTFVVTLPYAVSKEKVRAEEKFSASVAELEVLSKKKILLVEDNLFNQIVAVDTLEVIIPGIKVEVASNGQEALDKMNNGNYDLVLMDIQMPVMDGYEATKRIRADFDESKCSVPVIALTANATLAEVERCYEAGMNDCISKPFTPEILLEKIAGSLARQVS